MTSWETKTQKLLIYMCGVHALSLQEVSNQYCDLESEFTLRLVPVIIRVSKAQIILIRIDNPCLLLALFVLLVLLKLLFELSSLVSSNIHRTAPFTITVLASIFRQTDFAHRFRNLTETTFSSLIKSFHAVGTASIQAHKVG